MVQTRAFYNLLRLNGEAVEDLRKVPLESLWARIKCDKAVFHQFAETCDTPEALTDLLIPDEEEYDPYYLVVFEIWRRLFPERQTLSIFGDELDRIFEGENDELIQDGLANLLEILEQNTDEGADPKEVFSLVSEYCATDLESFLYEYISDLLDSGNKIYSLELIEDFSPFIHEPIWFDLLRIRHTAFTDLPSANRELKTLLSKVEDLDFALECIRYLSHHGDQELFNLAVKSAMPLLVEEEDLLDVLGFVQTFYQRIDHEKMEARVKRFIDQRPSNPVQRNDLKALQALLSE